MTGEQRSRTQTERQPGRIVRKALARAALLTCVVGLAYGGCKVYGYFTDEDVPRAPDSLQVQCQKNETKLDDNLKKLAQTTKVQLSAPRGSYEAMTARTDYMVQAENIDNSKEFLRGNCEEFLPDRPTAKARYTKSRDGLTYYFTAEGSTGVQMKHTWRMYDINHGDDIVFDKPLNKSVVGHKWDISHTYEPNAHKVEDSPELHVWDKWDRDVCVPAVQIGNTAPESTFCQTQ